MYVCEHMRLISTIYKNTKIYMMDSIQELKKEIIIGEIITQEEIEELNKGTINEQKVKIKEKLNFL